MAQHIEHGVFSGADRAREFIEETTTSLPPAPVAADVPDVDEGGGERPEAMPQGTQPQATIAASGSTAVADAPVSEPNPGRLMEAAAVAAAGAADQQVSVSGRARQGWRGVLARAGVPVAPGAAEVAQRQADAAVAAELHDARRVVRQATWTRAVGVLVANPKGGTGKTPLSLLMGGMLAALRGGGVVVVEVSDDPGALGFRAEGTPALGLGEFVRDVDQLATRAQVVGYTAPQTSYASVIGTVLDRSRPPLTYEAVTAVAARLDEHFEIRVMDSGNQPSSGPFRAATDAADVLVIPVMCAGDATLEALGMLRELRTTRSGRRLAENAIAVVMDDGRPQSTEIARVAIQELRAAGVQTMHRIPYDEHIAARGELSMGRLAPAALDALTLLMADVTRALTSTATATYHPTTTTKENT